MTQAVQLGLIINEVITYAFLQNRSDTIQLDRRGGYDLTIDDNRVGLPKGYAPEQSRSLGMTLMYGFSQQLGGELVISSELGLTIRLVFNDEQFNSASKQKDSLQSFLSIPVYPPI